MKFINLLKKELSELINAQMLAMLAIVLMLFMVMGNVMKSAITEVVEDNINPQINISDLDNTELTQQLIQTLKDSDAEVKIFSISGDDYAQMINDNDLKSLIIIPKGFTESVQNHERPKITAVSKMTSAATMANLTNDNTGALSFINSKVSDIIAERENISEDNLDLVNNPVKIETTTVIDDKFAEVSTSMVSSKLATQNLMLPIALLFLIMMTAQSLITSISNEKIDKTLETLLSAPISRVSIISSKMLAAAIVALINAGIMVLGFMKFMKGVTDDVSADVVQAAKDAISISDSMEKLGLNLSAGQYCLIGIQLFFTILICLTISIIIGSMVSDSKSAQTAILPLGIIVMLPYMLTLFTDVNALPTAIRLLVYAIPFTHTFTSMSNLMFGNTTIFFIGLVYQMVIFFILLMLSVKLFKSDKILTLSKTWSKKRRRSKKSNQED